MGDICDRHKICNLKLISFRGDHIRLLYTHEGGCLGRNGDPEKLTPTSTKETGHTISHRNQIIITTQASRIQNIFFAVNSKSNKKLRSTYKKKFRD